MRSSSSRASLYRAVIRSAISRSRRLLLLRYKVWTASKICSAAGPSIAMLGELQYMGCTGAPTGIHGRGTVPEGVTEIAIFDGVCGAIALVEDATRLKVPVADVTRLKAPCCEATVGFAAAP